MKRIFFVLALAACGSSSSKTDLSKMSPDEACRTISKRAFECKDTIIPAVSSAMKKAGADDATIKAMTQQMQMPMPCDKVDATSLSQMEICYDDDCGKLSQCFVGVAEQAMTPGGAADRAPAPHAPEVAAPVAPPQPPPVPPAIAP
jgi:hypothetical protein